MPPPFGDSGIAPPMIAPIVASPVLPRNPRRPALKLLPPSAAFPVFCAMTFLPCVAFFAGCQGRPPESRLA
jgi:hypothetical protein